MRKGEMGICKNMVGRSSWTRKDKTTYKPALMQYAQLFQTGTNGTWRERREEMDAKEEREVAL